MKAGPQVLALGVRVGSIPTSRRKMPFSVKDGGLAFRDPRGFNLESVEQGRVGNCRRLGYFGAGFDMDMDNANRLTQFARMMGLTAGLFALAGATVGADHADVTAPAGDGWPRLSFVRIEIAPHEMSSLRGEPRTRVAASWADGGSTVTNVSVRIKGRVGSFRSVDDKPSLTVDFDRGDPGRRRLGVTRVHLNNSVEDPSFQHQWLAGEIFRAAGIPAPRVAHAVVTLNGRRLGLYVLQEGITDDFLGRHFSPGVGNLYEPEPGPGCDVDGPMKLNPGRGVSDRSDLATLAEAAREPVPSRRWERLGEVLDRDRFIDYLALEILLAHRDGYALARNNYRLYHDPVSHRFQFVPVGLDRLFGRLEVPLRPQFAGRVAQAVQGTEAGRAALAMRIGTLFTNHLLGVDWPRRVVANGEALAPGLSRAEARSLRRECEDLAERIQRRIDAVSRHLAEPVMSPLIFNQDVALIPGQLWRPVDPPDGGRLQRVTREGREQLSIAAGPRTSASWRARLQLEPGRYRVEVPVRTRGLRALPLGRNQGVALTVDGDRIGTTHWELGDVDGMILRTEFAVRAGSEPAGAETPSVEVSCVLRASAGEAWFDSEAARVIRMR